MITSSSPVALVMPSQQEAGIFMQALAECNFRRITVFTTAEEAYEVVIRQQFPLFVTRMEMPKLSGIALIQKMRLTGNYGTEPHLFVCSKLAPELLSVLGEYDLEYVLTAPFSKAVIIQKFKHLLQSENSLSSFEQSYRDAKSALLSGILDMAQSYCESFLKEDPGMEKGLLLMGDVKLKQGDLASAESYYKKAMATNNKSVTALHKLAQIMIAKGAYTESAELLTRLTSVSPLNIRLLENAGLSNYEAERYDLAREQMDKLRGLDETNKTAATVTAKVMIKTGDFEGLVDTLRKGFDEKELIQFLNNAGAKLSKDEEVEAALRMYSAAVAQIVDSKYLYAIHYNMGIAYRKLGKPERALAHYEKSLKIKPDFEKAQAAILELKKSG